MDHSPEQSPLLVKADAMAAMLQISRSAFYQLLKAGAIPAVSVGPRLKRFDPGEVVAALRKGGQP